MLNSIKNENSQSFSEIISTEDLNPKGESITLKLTLLMAIACGMAVANIYYNQPMLEMISAAFPGQHALIGFIPTATQLGYALGLILLVPMGDCVERRFIICANFIALSAMAYLVSISSTAIYLLASSALLGVAASVAQQVLPFAAELSSTRKRGTTIGVIMSGLLCGILLGRVFAGFIAVNYGWRNVFLVSSALAFLMGLLLLLTLPRKPARSKEKFINLITSLSHIWKSEPKLRNATLIQAGMFGSFSVLWTILAFQLSQAFHLGADTAGMFGLVGTIGVLIAPLAGKYADHKGPHYIVGKASILMLLAWLILGVWNSIAGLVFGVVLLDLAAQSSQVSNQHVIQNLKPEIRNRLNAILMTGMFIGGGVGSALGAYGWELYQWNGVCLVGALFATFAVVIHHRAAMLNNN